MRMKKKAINVIELDFSKRRNKTDMVVNGTPGVLYTSEEKDTTMAPTVSNEAEDMYTAQRKANAHYAASCRRDGSVQPLRTQEEITAVANYLLSMGKYALRNWMIFIFGICTGLRCSDIVCRKWKDVLDEYGNVRNELCVVEQKTSKKRMVVIDDRLYSALCYFVTEYKRNNTIDMEGYLFASHKRSQEHVQVDTVRRILRKAVDEAVNKERLEYNEHLANNSGYDQNGNIARPKAIVIAGSHTMRKTYAYQQYVAATTHADELGMYGQTALTYVQASLNHESARDTTRYLDLNRELDMRVNRFVNESIKIYMPHIDIQPSLR